MLKNIIEKAETKAGSQKELSTKFKINYRRLCDYKAGRRTPDDAIVIKMAQYIGIDPIQALFESKAEYDIDNADLWKWCARRESNPRPSASETYRTQLLVTISYIINLINRPLRHIEHNQGEHNASYSLYHHAPINP